MATAEDRNCLIKVCHPNFKMHQVCLQSMHGLLGGQCVMEAEIVETTFEPSFSSVEIAKLNESYIFFVVPMATSLRSKCTFDCTTYIAII